MVNDMKYHFTTNSRIIPKIFANYPNTFLAFCELINNSLQAKASQIRIGIEQISDSLNPAAVRQITIKDNGVGVSQSGFKKKILEIGTDVKRGGKGIGRFAAFQIGSFLEIETVAYDNKSDKYVKSVFQLDGNKLESNRLETVNLEIKHEEFDSETDTYYQVTISGIYGEQITCAEKQKRLHKNFLKENFEEAIFMQYPLQILNDEITFFINGIKLGKDDYLIGKIETRTEIYNDPEGESHELTLSFINYKSRSRKMRAFLRVENNNIRTIGYAFEYNCDIPDPNGWLIYIDSKLFDNNSDIFRNISISDLDIDSNTCSIASKHLLTDFSKIGSKNILILQKN
ncbi:MAG: hypothetical protein HC887_08410 [Desulfobacteraceae bacterium]|nr:hypothetical protein [Desulfobacteraceae bacterium]